MSDEPIRCYVSGDEYDGLYIWTDDPEMTDHLLRPSTIERLRKAQEELEAAELAVLEEIGVGDLAGLRAARKP